MASGGSSVDRSGSPARVIALGMTLLLASCSARVASSLLARSVTSWGSGPPGSRSQFGENLARQREQLPWALRIAASHAALFVVLLALARTLADEGNTRAVICAYLCVGIAALAALIWMIARLFWTRLSGDENSAAPVGWVRLAQTRTGRFAVVHAGSLLASLLMLALAATLLVPTQAIAN